MELNITELREQKRPLWMSSLETDNYADMLGGGGDIWTDRLPLEWERHTGQELTEEELSTVSESGSQEQDFTQGGSQEESFSQSQQEGSQAQSPPSQGLGVNAQADVNVSGLSETVEDVTNIVKDTVGTLGGILKGAAKKVKDTTK